MSLRILIVKQEGHAREGLRSILSSEGHAVTVAGDIWEDSRGLPLSPSTCSCWTTTSALTATRR